MQRPGRGFSTRWIGAGALLLMCGVGAGGPARVAASQAAVNQHAQAMADFKERLDRYAALHRKVQESLPKLSKEAAPEDIDRHQRFFLSGIAKARATAKPGDIFTPPIQTTIKALIRGTFNSGNRETLRESIQDEDTGPVRIRVNGRYPDAVPLASMPAELLKNLPALPPVVEYRFVGNSLVMLDPEAHLIVDFIPNALPTR